MSAKDLILNIIADDHTENGFKGFEKSASNAVERVSALITGINFGDAVSKSLDAGAANAKLSAALDLNKAEAARAGKITADLYRDNFGESTEQVSAAVGSVMTSIDGMRNASSESVSDITGKLLNLSTTFEIDVSRSAQVAGQMIRTGMATDGKQAVDLLTATLSRVPENVRDDLIDAVDEYGPFFQSAGLSGEKMMTMLVNASAKGMYGIDKTGDAVKELGISLTDVKKKSTFDELGLDWQTMSGQFLAGGDSAAAAVQMVMSSLQGVQDPATQARLAMELIPTPLEDLSVSEIPKFISALQGTESGLGQVEGAAQRMGDKLSASTSSKAEDARRDIESFYTSLVSVPGPMADIIAVATALGPELITAGASVFTLGRGVIGLAVGIPKMIVGIVSWTAAISANNLAWLASPTTWIILGIVAAVGLLVAAGFWLVQNWDGVVTWLGDAWNNIVGAVQFALGVLGNLFLNWTPIGWIIQNWQPIADFFGTVWSGISGGAKAAIDGVIGTVQNLVNFFTGIPQAIADSFRWLADLLNSIGQTVVNALIWLWNNTLGKINFTVPDWVPLIGGSKFGFPQIQVPKLAAGGIATQPTIALIGEAGPEAVVPLGRASQYGFGGGDGAAPFEAAITLMLDGAVLARVIRRVEARRRF